MYSGLWGLIYEPKEYLPFLTKVQKPDLLHGSGGPEEGSPCLTQNTRCIFDVYLYYLCLNIFTNFSLFLLLLLRCCLLCWVVHCVQDTCVCGVTMDWRTFLSFLSQLSFQGLVSSVHKFSVSGLEYFIKPPHLHSFVALRLDLSKPYLKSRPAPRCYVYTEHVMVFTSCDENLF